MKKLSQVFGLWFAIGLFLAFSGHLVWAATQTAEPDAKDFKAQMSILENREERAWKRAHAAYNLGKIGTPEAQALLLKHLEDPKEHESVRADSAQGLRLMGAKAKEAIPALITAMDDKSATVRHQSAYALAEIDPTDDRVLQAFVNGLDDPAERVRVWSINGLRRAEEKGAFAISHLMPLLLKDKEDTVRNAVASALGSMADAPEAETAVPSLMQALEDPSPRVRANAVFAIGLIRKPVPDTIPAVIKLLEDPDRGPRLSAIYAVSMLRKFEGAEAAVPGLIKLLKDPDPKLQGKAAETLMRIGTPEAREAAEAYKAANPPKPAAAAQPKEAGPAETLIREETEKAN